MEGVWWVRGREGGTTTSTTINNNNQPTFINNAMRCVFLCYSFFFFHGSLSFACPLPREPPSPPLDILPLPYPTWDPHTNLWVGLWEGPTVGTEVHTVSSLSPSYSRTHARMHCNRLYRQGEEEEKQKEEKGNRRGWVPAGKRATDGRFGGLGARSQRRWTRACNLASAGRRVRRGGGVNGAGTWDSLGWT